MLHKIVICVEVWVDGLNGNCIGQSPSLILDN
jgi:hypothetical protein